MSKLFHRLFISLLSVVLFSAILAGYQYMFVHGQEISYGLLMGIHSFYTAPVFILGGIPATYLIDYIMKKEDTSFLDTIHSYFRSFGMYGVAGIIVAMIYFAITSMANGQFYFTLSESVSSIMIGIAAAAVYYHIQLLLHINWEKLKKKQLEEQHSV
ncbi:hypothetical protein CR194_15610 [Salipaludibacillus keqinensis]|uniref:Uncharacterized protein n=1 Tax=Salipaludibacillus keqinensis TaxID=2045207 RepID=A0A323TI01_9BACI|nr:hypothetical protein [Salipaludibacillus keqinensis]PYZ92263.1 hypothetical protein CR194_15610 [Salipaludibacillus keqinensis]